MSLARITSIGLGSAFTLIVSAGCTSSTSDSAADDAAVTAGTPGVAPLGTYHRAATPDTREGELLISAATVQTLSFEITGRVTIKPDPNDGPGAVGTHEGSAAGAATGASGTFTFRQDKCVLRFAISGTQRSPRISVHQEEGSICQPDALVSLDGDYDLTAAGAQGDAITLANWQNHPTIVAVRSEVRGIEASHLTVQKRSFCENEGTGEIERDKGTDSAGKIRKLVLMDGGEDGAGIRTYYYDASGKLRFVFATENDVHGNSSEDRVYFDASGRRVWEVFRHASDPEHNNPDVTHAPFEPPPDPMEIGLELTDPQKVFDGPPVCR